MKTRTTVLTSLALVTACGVAFAADDSLAGKFEGGREPLLGDKLDAFMGEPQFAMQELFKGRGGWNIVTARDGTVLAFNGTTVRRSADGGKTWPMKRLVFDGPSAYSNLGVGRPGTPSAGTIYLLFEGGQQMYSGIQAATFNLSCLLGGEKTGDGDLPAWVTESAAKH